MKRGRTIRLTKIILALVALFLVFSGTALYCGIRYVNHQLLLSNENMAVDIAQLVKNNFEISDDEVTYMKSLTFNEMEIDSINRRLMDTACGVALRNQVKNVYILAPLAEDEIKYFVDESNADFFGFEVGTPMNAVWLLNGATNDKGVFAPKQREDIYRYTVFQPEKFLEVERKGAVGEYSADAWGNFVTGYVPIYTVEHNFVGILGIDINPDQYQAGARNMVMMVVSAVMIVIISAIGLFLWFYFKYTRADRIKYEEKVEKYLKQMHAMADMNDENMIAKGRHNLTQNVIAFYCEKRKGAITAFEGGDYGTAVEKLSCTAVSPEKAEEIACKMNRSQLLKDFANGITEGSIEYLRKMPQGENRWILTRYSMYEEPESGDIVCFVYSYDETEHVVDRQITTKLSNMECEALGLLDVTTGQYKLRNIYSAIEGLPVAASGDFEECARLRIQTIAVKSECQSLLQEFQIENIRAQLEKKEDYYIVYSVTDDEKNIRRKRFRLCYLDDSKNVILYSRTDITDIYQKEQEQLKKTEEALEAAKCASEAKTEFFSRMSHDMRTPMNGILGIAELSEDEGDMEVLRENITKIRSSGEYLLGLINDTLDFQKIESGKLTLEPEIVDAGKLIESVFSMVQNTADEKEINVRVVNQNVQLDCHVCLDQMRIKQIFINLLSNAVKFTPQGGTVEINLECIKREGMISDLRIIIADTGIGMSEEFLKNGIFKPFSQENNAVTAGYAGTGLGLSIAKKLIELMGGSIEVESERGVGTVFTILLAVKRVNEADIRKIVNADVHHQSEVTERLKGIQVLLAEDHPLNAEITRRMLEKVDGKMTWVKNGQECVDCFAKSQENYFDIILMDIRMPVMDGYMAARKIRALPREDASQIPILAMTANAYDEDVKESYASGMNEHISKPVEPKNLYEVMARALRNP